MCCYSRDKGSPLGLRHIIQLSVTNGGRVQIWTCLRWCPEECRDGWGHRGHRWVATFHCCVKQSDTCERGFAGL